MGSFSKNAPRAWFAFAACTLGLAWLGCVASMPDDHVAEMQQADTPTGPVIPNPCASDAGITLPPGAVLSSWNPYWGRGTGFLSWSSPWGGSPYGASPYGASPWGLASPWGASPWGPSAAGWWGMGYPSMWSPYGWGGGFWPGSGLQGDPEAGDDGGCVLTQ